MAHYHRVPYNLPPELLGRIFQLYAISSREPWLSADDTTTLPACSISDGPYEWVRVTHVCRYWRDVALQAPLLWSHIILTKNIECINAFLARSQQAPLTVVQPRVRGGCFIESILPMACVRLVLAEMRRIRSLELYMKWWIFDDMAELLCRSAPALKYLKLSTPHGLYDSGFRKPVISFNHGDVVSLQKLTLGAYGFPWSDPAPFKALKSLRIERGITEKPSVEQVVYALQFMGDLTTLSLDDLFAPSAKSLSSLPPNTDVAVLRNLERLELSGDIVACSSLLAHLVIPGTTYISLDYHRKGRNADLPLAMPTICAKLTGSTTVGREAFVSSPSPPARVCLESSDYTYHLTCQTHGSAEAKHDQSGTMSVWVATEPGTLAVLFRSLPMQTVKVLELCGRTDWRDMERYARDVTELHLIDWNPREIKALLLEGCDVDQRVLGHGDAQERELAFPCLQQLVVGSMRPDTSALGGKTDSMRLICDAADLRNRHSSVARLQKARFEV